MFPIQTNQQIVQLFGNKSKFWSKHPVTKLRLKALSHFLICFFSHENLDIIIFLYVYLSKNCWWFVFNIQTQAKTCDNGVLS